MQLIERCMSKVFFSNDCLIQKWGFFLQYIPVFFRCEGVAPVPIIGDRDWLDGFTDSNQPDLLLISTERQYVTLHHLSQNNKL